MSNRLPVVCRLRRHGWRRTSPILLTNGAGHPGGWTRTTCRRCRHLDVTHPAELFDYFADAHDAGYRIGASDPTATPPNPFRDRADHERGELR